MRAHPIRIVLLVSSSAALLALGGCAYPGYYRESAVVVAPYAPPALVAETYAYPPVVGDVWIGGYWTWSSGRHVWVPGRWEHPRSGYHWVPRTWEQHGSQWHQHGGHWERG